MGDEGREGFVGLLEVGLREIEMRVLGQHKWKTAELMRRFASPGLRDTGLEVARRV